VLGLEAGKERPMADGLAAMTMAVQAVENLRDPARRSVSLERPRFVRYKRRREYPGGRDPRTRGRVLDTVGPRGIVQH